MSQEHRLILQNIVELTESTRQANLRFFEKEEDVPTHAITMGIGSIMKAKQTTCCYGF